MFTGCFTSNEMYEHFVPLLFNLMKTSAYEVLSASYLPAICHLSASYLPATALSLPPASLVLHGLQAVPQ